MLNPAVPIFTTRIHGVYFTNE